MDGINKIFSNASKQHIKHATNLIDYCFENSIPFLFGVRIDNTWESLIPDDYICQEPKDNTMLLIQVENLKNSYLNKEDGTINTELKFFDTEKTFSFKVKIARIDNIYIGDTVNEIVLMNPVYNQPITLSRLERHQAIYDNFDYLDEIAADCIWNTDREDVLKKIEEDQKS